VDAAVLGANENNATITPNPLVLPNGETGKITLNWTGLKPGSYIGRITVAGASEPTFVTVVVNDAGVASVAPTSDSAAAQSKLQNQQLERPNYAI
ncbi:MAG TPA: hypothetical protein VF885_25765, partial [Arthrobacter sp.]